MIGEVWFGPIQSWENVSDETFVQHIVGLIAVRDFIWSKFLANLVKFEIDLHWLGTYAFYFSILNIGIVIIKNPLVL